MGLRSWLGRTISLLDGNFWVGYFGSETWAGKSVNEASALNLSAWWRCTRLYADVTGSMPIKMYERDADNNRVETRDPPEASLVGLDPNKDQTSQEFWSGMAAGMAMTGNAMAEKRFVANRVVALEPLPYDTLVDRSRGTMEYRYNDRGKTYWLPPEKVFHVRGFTLGKSDMGMSPLTAGRQALGISLATEESAGRTFAQGLRASGFFTGPRLKPEQRLEFTRTFIDPIVGNDAKAHYGILETGFDFKPLNIPPKDAEMLLSRRFNVEEICRFMGVPPILAGHSADGQTMWGSGVEAIINTWLTQGLDAFLTYIEKALGKRLLNAADRRRYYFEFERNSLLRLDSAARATFMSTMIQNGVMTPNEARRKQNDLPKEGGDQLLVNGTLVPLATLRAAPPPGVAKENVT